MSATIMESTPAYTKLELRTAYGSVYRDVASIPPRQATTEEIPVIDVAGIFGDSAARTALAGEIAKAAKGTGFFYIKNHGIDEQVIKKAHDQALGFFKRPEEEKKVVAKFKSRYYNGWSGPGTSHASPTESVDSKEGFSWRYAPQYDPMPKNLNEIPAEVKPYLRGEEFVWSGTDHIPDFKVDSIKYWQSCLTFARKLVQIFAIILDLPETYFDALTTYPGSDGVYNYYPAMTPEAIAATSNKDVGLGSHTDLQCFTLLWQDLTGGLQVLNAKGEWIKATPIAGTFVVNIGDYLMRLSNDRFKSTVHRVYNRATVDRISMPFFFGFNFNETCGVLPTCTDKNNPPKYEPISCGEWCQLRFKLTDTPLAANEIAAY